MILLYNLIFISLITFTILYIINKLLNVKYQSFKIISYLVIISSILVNFVLLNPIENDYSEFYLRVIVILFLMVFIIISYKMIFKKSLLDLLNNTKTTINNTEINHNYQTNIDTVDNSNTFNTSQTNNHLEQNNNVTNIDTVDNSNTFNTSQTNNHLEQNNNVTNIDTIDNSNTFNSSQTNNHFEEINNVTNIEKKQSIHKKQKEDNAKSSKKTTNNLSEEQLRKIYNFFIDHNLLVDYNLEFENFKDIFLKEPIILKADVPTLREFYNNLKVQKNITFNNITDDFLIYFINSNDNNIYDYKQFGNHKNTISKFSDDIIELFKKF